jgi:hypothetical protein
VTFSDIEKYFGEGLRLAVEALTEDKEFRKEKENEMKLEKENAPKNKMELKLILLSESIKKIKKLKDDFPESDL